MPETTAIGKITIRAGAFILVAVTLSTLSFSVMSTVVLFRDSAIPVLFELANSVPLGINSYLVVSYAFGFLTSYVFFYRGGFDRLRSYFVHN
jgi:hypothetical protein